MFHASLQVYRYLVSASEVAPIQLCSVYAAHGGEPTFTNCTPDFTGTLDYIFLSGSSLRAVSLLEVPGPESADVIGGLPNHHHPSDHLPIGADFSVLQSPWQNMYFIELKWMVENNIWHMLSPPNVISLIIYAHPNGVILT